MIFRKLLLMTLVAFAGVQSIAFASDALQAQAEKPESWDAWYKRNRVLVGAAVGAVVISALTYSVGSRHNNYMRSAFPLATYNDFNYYMQDHYIASSVVGAITGAIAAKLNILGGFCLGAIGCGLANLAKPYQRPFMSHVPFFANVAASCIVGSLSQRRKTLPGLILGGAGLVASASFISDSPASVFLALPGAIVGAGINELYNSDQELEEDKSKKE